MHVLSMFPADNIFPICSATFLSSGKLVLILFIDCKLRPDAVQPKGITHTCWETAAQGIISSGHVKQHVKTGLAELWTMLPGNTGPQTSPDPAPVFTQTPLIELLSELIDVCSTLSSSSAVQQTKKYLFCLNNLSRYGTSPAAILCSQSLFPNQSFGFRRHFPAGTMLQRMVLHKCLVEAPCTGNVALTAPFPPAIIHPASLGKCILSSNLGCLQLTSPSAWQPSRQLFQAILQQQLGRGDRVAFPRVMDHTAGRHSSQDESQMDTDASG